MFGNFGMPGLHYVCLRNPGRARVSGINQHWLFWDLFGGTGYSPGDLVSLDYIWTLYRVRKDSLDEFPMVLCVQVVSQAPQYF